MPVNAAGVNNIPACRLNEREWRWPLHHSVHISSKMKKPFANPCFSIDSTFVLWFHALWGNYYLLDGDLKTGPSRFVSECLSLCGATIESHTLDIITAGSSWVRTSLTEDAFFHHQVFHPHPPAVTLTWSNDLVADWSGALYLHSHTVLVTLAAGNTRTR